MTRPGARAATDMCSGNPTRVPAGTTLPSQTRKALGDEAHYCNGPGMRHTRGTLAGVEPRGCLKPGPRPPLGAALRRWPLRFWREASRAKESSFRRGLDVMDVCSMDVCSMCTVVKKAGSTLFMVLSTVACRGARYVRVVGPRGPVGRLGPTATVWR